MARVPMLNAASTKTPEVGELFKSAQEMGLERFMNQFGALAHHPPLLHAIHELMRAYYTQSVVDKKYLELAILLISRLNRCSYCVVHHTPPAITEGISAEQLEAIENDSWRDSDLFDPAERLVLRFAEQMNQRQGRIDDSLFEELLEHFDQQQIVELTVRCGMCEFFNRFNEALQLDIEPEARRLLQEIQ